MGVNGASISCFYCKKRKDSWKDLKRCGRCKGPLYCNEACQRNDWSSHKPNCKKTGEWYDGYRACQDGSVHEGKLELITWDFHDEEDDTDVGWGGVFIEEVEDHKKTFHEKYNGDLKRFFNYWPQGFRWTCCGMGGDQNFGCDHHGAGAKPCTCDFCRMGEPLPDSIYNAVSQSEYGLKLRRGPDPRSRVSPAHISIIKAGQALTGMSGA
ncbi:hypothetical protein BKA70DRAFT_1391112 [Coprinopsis sp. MPI-PUGE-AT-0042]|nr:hypothetical protein BKA70DRAFT_1391112 [Coprinopsis sp. MPI-PUGE-AT-0042]